jgi:hypothetical protein
MRRVTFWVRVVRDIGFPAAVAAFVLVRLDVTLAGLAAELEKLAREVARLALLIDKLALR